LINLLRNEPNKDLVADLGHALGGMKKIDPEMQKKIAEILADKESHRSAAAAVALNGINPKTDEVRASIAAAIHARPKDTKSSTEVRMLFESLEERARKLAESHLKKKQAHPPLRPGPPH
jgi:hypothetical protein